MKKPLISFLAVLLVSAAFGTAPVAAHERTASTSISLHADDKKVDRGDKVKFSGRLTSPWKKCRKWKAVTLFRDGSAVGAKQTMKNGKFSFSKNVQGTSVWRVSFAGKSWGVHPHVHECLGSSSRTIRIQVRRGGGGGGGGGNGGAVAGSGGSGGGGTVVQGAGDVGVQGAGGVGVLADGASAVTGSDIFPALSAMIALGVLGLVGLAVGLRRTRSSTS
jgi:hypothetical protein